jgi:hypothetical protein
MPQRIDESGLPQEVVEDLQRLVTALQGNLASSRSVEDEPSHLSLDDFERILDAVSEGLPLLPQLPRDFSRSNIYCDHD